MTLSNEKWRPRLGVPSGGDGGALLLALWRLSTRSRTGLQLSEQGLTSGPFPAWYRAARAAAPPPSPAPAAYYPDDLVMDRGPNMWRMPDRANRHKPGFGPEVVPVAAAALPIAGALAARVLAATGQHLGPAAIAALLALGLNELAREVMRYLGEGGFMRPMLTPIAGDFGGPGWVENTADLIADPPFVGIRSDQAFGPVNWLAEGLHVSQQSQNPPDPFGAVPISLPYTGVQDLTGFGNERVDDPGFYWTTRHWYPEPGAGAFDRVQSIILVDAPPMRRPAWADRAPAVSSPWPQGWKGGYSPPPAASSVAVTRSSAQPMRETKTETQPRRARERKTVVISPAMRQVLQSTTQGRALLEWLLEAGDAIGAVFKALPPQIRRIAQQQWYEEQFSQGNMQPGRISPDAMAATIVREFRWLDAEGVVRELAWENFQDSLYGMSSQGIQQALTRILGNRFQGAQGTISPNWDHFLDPSLPFAGPYTVINQYKMKEWVPAQPLHWVMQAITGRAERDARFMTNGSAELRIRAIQETARRKADRQGRRNRARDYAVWRSGREASGYVENSMNRRNTGFNSNPKSQ